MTYQVAIIRPQGRKIAKNPIGNQPHQFETREDAEYFANSMRMNWCSHWKTQGLRAPQFQVVEANH